MEQEVTVANMWVVGSLIVFLSMALIAVGVSIGIRRLERENDALEARCNRLQIMNGERQAENVLISHKWLENMRTLRFSQKANCRYKRHIKTLRGYLDAADAWPKQPLERNAAGQFKRRDGKARAKASPKLVGVVQNFKTGKSMSGISGGVDVETEASTRAKLGKMIADQPTFKDRKAGRNA
jgi:hypothetical protein